MKKTSIFIALISVGIGVRAQGVSFGIKGGLNIANQNISSSSGSAPTSAFLSYHAGAYLTIMITHDFGVQPELMFSSQGCGLEDPNYFSGGTGSTLLKKPTIDYYLNYVSMPVLLRTNLSDLISLHLGPQFGVLTSASFDAGDGEANNRGAYEKTDWGIVVGGEIDLPRGLNFTVRYTYGLTDVNKTSYIETKNTNIQFSIGYRLVGAKK